MSRIGNKPIPVPQGVKINVAAGKMTVEGPKGRLIQVYKPEIEIRVENGQALVTRKNNAKPSRAFHGLYRNLLANMITGVTQGFQKTLVIAGVGYRAEIVGKNLMMTIGYSNPIEIPFPEGIEIKCESQTKIVISGIDKQRVGQICAEIRSIRAPEPYKGKGIRYETEHIRKKVGKSGVK